uniref:Uncharacterized protein ORF16 n=1 Tax=Metapseudomonas resinovorans TaxID=53412 RepID=Q9AQN1_METRE|nr:hypothetical protein [Pseudomonas resinovorans]
MQLGVQPGARWLRARWATHLVRLAAHAALGGGQFDKVLGAVDPFLAFQVGQFFLQMLARLRGRVGGAVAHELAAAVLDKVQQACDLGAHRRRHLGLGGAITSRSPAAAPSRHCPQPLLNACMFVPPSKKCRL